MRPKQPMRKPQPPIPKPAKSPPLPERRVRPGCELWPSPPRRTRRVEFYAQPPNWPGLPPPRWPAFIAALTLGRVYNQNGVMRMLTAYIIAAKQGVGFVVAGGDTAKRL